jgi:6-phosphogluconate dehydrogenase
LRLLSDKRFLSMMPAQYKELAMKIGFVGLGKMGGNMVLRLTVGSTDGSIKGTHSVVGFARDPNPDLAGVGSVEVVSDLKVMVSKLAAPRVVWVMVPSGKVTEDVIIELAGLLSPGDTLIDGGNSNYKDSIRRAGEVGKKGLKYIDVGTSGGIWGRQEGYCMMVGGAAADVAACKPIFDTLAPTNGWARMGEHGSGHFVKMVHNGIEYGMMQAYAEGFEILQKSKFSLDLHGISKVWNRGSVVRSWLLELAERALEHEPNLESILPYVEDSGEGRWTIQAAIDEDVPAPVITASLFARFASRNTYNFSARFNAALRNQFGGHAVKKT